MNITGYAGNAAQSHKVIESIDKFQIALASGNNRKLWKIVDFQYRKKYRKSLIARIFSRYKRAKFLNGNDLMNAMFTRFRNEISAEALHFVTPTLCEVKFRIGDAFFLVNFIAQKKAYSTDQTAQFHVNPLSVRHA